MDRLAVSVGKTRAEPEAVFTYTRGLSRDLRRHVHLFAVRKGTSWRIAE